MTITDDTGATTAPDAPELISIEAVGIDWLLQKLVKMTNKVDGLTIGVTVQVGGMLVSGHLIGGKQYFKELAQVMANGFDDPDIGSSMEEAISSYSEIYLDPPGDSEDDELPQFVHLRSARFFNTSARPIPGDSGVLWRGKISSADGFFLGVLSAVEH